MSPTIILYGNISKNVSVFNETWPWRSMYYALSILVCFVLHLLRSLNRVFHRSNLRSICLFYDSTLPSLCRRRCVCAMPTVMHCFPCLSAVRYPRLSSVLYLADDAVSGMRGLGAISHTASVTARRVRSWGGRARSCSTTVVSHCISKQTIIIYWNLELKIVFSIYVSSPLTFSVPYWFCWHDDMLLIVIVITDLMLTRRTSAYMNICVVCPKSEAKKRVDGTQTNVF